MATIIELNTGFEFKNNKANKTYTIEKLIGSGGFADVFLVHENSTDIDFLTKKKYRYWFEIFLIIYVNKLSYFKICIKVYQTICSRWFSGQKPRFNSYEKFYGSFFGKILWRFRSGDKY